MNDNLARAPYAPAWSAASASALPTPLSVTRPERRPRIQAVPDRAVRRAKPRLLYAVIAVAGISAVVVIRLLISAAVTQGAYVSDNLQIENKALQRTVQTATENLERVKSPQFLATNAEAIGMVPNTNP